MSPTLPTTYDSLYAVVVTLIAIYSISIPLILVFTLKELQRIRRKLSMPR